MASTTSGFFVDEKSKKKVLDKLKKLPANLKRNAITSALTAGAKVVAKRAKSKAPACLRPSIKVKRRKQDKGGNVRVAVVAGRGHSADGAGATVDRIMGNVKAANFLSKNGGVIDSCLPAIWVELGTYQARNLTKDPYSPATKKRHPEYATLGHTGSDNWNIPHQWIQPQPFMRPALREASSDGSMRNAIIAKLDDYIESKIGV